LKTQKEREEARLGSMRCIIARKKRKNPGTLVTETEKRRGRKGSTH